MRYESQNKRIRRLFEAKWQKIRIRHIWTGQAQALLELLNCSNKSVIYTLPSDTLILRNEQAYCM